MLNPRLILKRVQSDPKGWRGQFALKHGLYRELVGAWVRKGRMPWWWEAKLKRALKRNKAE